MKKIVIVDDHKEISDLLERVLNKDNYSAKAFYNAKSAIEFIKQDCPDLVLLDIQMPDIDGLEALNIIKKLNPKIKIIMITAYAERQNHKNLFKNGAIEFISKPFKLKDIRMIVSKVLSSSDTEYRSKLQNKGVIIGQSEAIKKCMNEALKFSNNDSPIIIYGESGTGKELLADFIHYNSVRKHSKIIKINCAAIPLELLESELFGYEKGAFTSAMISKKGKLEEVDQGTLFLDEICDMNMKLQTKLLRVLEYKTFERLGGNKEINSDFRIIVATNKDILEEVKKGNFREDLYYRLNTFDIIVPPLRERKEDINCLVSYFIDLFRKEYVTTVKKISDDVCNVLKKHTWPGNVRELNNVIQRMVSVAHREEIEIDDMPKYLFEESRLDKSEYHNSKYKMLSIEELEKKHIINVLKKVKENKKEAVHILGISEKTLYNKMKKYNI